MPRQFDWEWIPRISLGGIRFDEPLPNNIRGLELERDPSLEDEETIVFRAVGGETRLYVEDGVVRTINCQENFSFNGHAVIGKSIESVMRLIGGSWTPNDEGDDFREFDQKEKCITALEENGHVTNLVVWGQDPDE